MFVCQQTLFPYRSSKDVNVSDVNNLNAFILDHIVVATVYISDSETKGEHTNRHMYSSVTLVSHPTYSSVRFHVVLQIVEHLPIDERHKPPLERSARVSKPAHSHVILYHSLQCPSAVEDTREGC